MANEKDLILQFLDAVLKVRDNREGHADEATRRSIAKELGITDEELLEARKVGEDHLVRGQGFLKHGLLDDALTSFLAADALLPDDLRVLQALGNTYVLKGDKARGRLIAARMLSLDPKSEGAFHILRLVETRSKAWALPVAAAILVLGTGGVLFTFFRQPASQAPPVIVVHSSAPTLPSSQPAESTTPVDLDQRCKGNYSLCSAMIPRGAAIPDAELWFDPASSGLYRESERILIKLVGRIRGQGQSEHGELTVDLVCLDKGEREIDRFPIKVFPAFNPPLRPGDTSPFYISERANPNTAALKVEIRNHRKTPSPGEYEPPTPIAVTLPPGAPRHLQFNFARRTRQVETYDGSSSVKAVLELTNTGKGVIRAFEATVQCLDAKETVLYDTSITMVYSHMVPMDPGEKRADDYSCYAKGTITKERVVITKIE